MNGWTYLDTGHQISTSSYDRNQILLDGGGGVVTSVGNVLQENGVKLRAHKGGDGCWNTETGDFERDDRTATLFEMGTGGLFGRAAGFTKKLLLQTVVTQTYNVVSVHPTTMTKAPSAP